MKITKVSFLPDSNEIEAILDNILYNVADYMNASNDTALFGELNQRFIRETGLIKSKSDKFYLINGIHRVFKRFKSKISMKEKLFQRMSNIETVEKILERSTFKVGNFEWKVVVHGADDYHERDLLANCLSDYDTFLNALDAGVIEIINTINIHDEIKMDTSELNSTILEGLEEKKFSFYRNPIILKYNDEELSSLIKGYKEVTSEDSDYAYDHNNPDGLNNIYNYFIIEYLQELRDIAFRLYCIYSNLLISGISILNMDDEGEEIFHKLYHFINLEDLEESIDKKDDYLKQYDDLSHFYKMYIHNLKIALLDALNKCNCKDSDTSKRVNTDPDYSELTLKLIYSLKNNKN